MRDEMNGRRAGDVRRRGKLMVGNVEEIPPGDHHGVEHEMFKLKAG